MSADKTSRKAALWVFLIFVLGIGIGALGMYAGGRRVFGAAQHPGQHSREQGRAMLEDRLNHELSLTPDQTKQLDVILLDLQNRYDAVHKQYAPQIDEVRQRGREQVRAILTPEQRGKYEEFLRQVDGQRKKMDEERNKK
jgi:hypothetical protein